MAEQLIRALSEDFNPENYKDDYREKLTQMIERKVQGQEIVTEAPEPEVKGRVIDLMAALEASLAKAVQKQTPEKKSRRKKAAAG
jgi:DNA end-binding protein Ku